MSASKGNGASAQVCKHNKVIKRGRGRPRKKISYVNEICEICVPNTEKSKETLRQAVAKKEVKNACQSNESSMTTMERVTKYMPLVENLAHGLMRHVPAHVDRNDMISEGYIGLIEAAKRFKPQLGNKFETFARQRIAGAMYDWLRSLDLLPRSARDKLKAIEAIESDISKTEGRPATDKEIAERLGVSVGVYQKSLATLSYSYVSIDGRHTSAKSGKEYIGFELSDHSPDDPVESIYATNIWRQVKSCINSLPEKQRLILALMSLEALNLKEIGAMLDYSPSTVRQMRERSMFDLKEKLTVLKEVI